MSKANLLLYLQSQFILKFLITYRQSFNIVRNYIYQSSQVKFITKIVLLRHKQIQVFPILKFYKYLKIQTDMNHQTITVCVTGAAGQIAYSFIPQLLKGNVFGQRPINLKLLDITPALNVLKGVILEINDCAYPLLNSVEYGDKALQMFKDVDVIVFLGGFPRKPGMERKDLLQKNKDIFVVQSEALSVAKPEVKCIVIANPANTNAYILSHFAPHIKKENITCLTRLDHNRAISQIAQKTHSKYNQIEGVMIFGNHSTTQYPCIKHIKVHGKPINELVESQWLEKTFISKVQKRGGQILEVRGGSSVFSAANAVADHLRDWYNGTQKVVSMGVVSDGSYGVPEGLFSSFPVKCKNFTYQIVKGYELSQFCRQKIAVTVKQLQSQIEDAQLKAAL